MAKINLLESVKAVEERNRITVKKLIDYSRNKNSKIIFDLDEMCAKHVDKKELLEALNGLRKRTKQTKWNPSHFGRALTVRLGDVVFDITVQRFVELSHICRNIIPKFDPRIIQCITATYNKKTGKYHVWEGLQTCATLYFLMMYGFLDGDDWRDWPVQIKIVDDDLVVPGGLANDNYAIGNLTFTCLNHRGREPVEDYYILRSETNGVRRFNSNYTNEIQSDKIWNTLEKYNLLPGTKNDRHKQGFLTHISGLKKNTEHGTEKFSVKTLDTTCKLISLVNMDDEGINSSFYMAIHMLFNLIEAQNIKLGKEPDQFNFDRFVEFLKKHYAKKNISKAFREYAYERLQEGRAPGMPANKWSDACTVPYLIDDYMKHCKKQGFVTGKLPLINTWTDFIK